LLPKSNRYTTTTAKSVGWIWEVPLTNRRGAGYVYSSKHITDEDAITEYCEHYLDTDPAKIRKLKFTPEVCKDSIKTNVGVAGLSGGFIEPLEATAIFLTFFTIRQIYKFLNGERKAAVLNRNVEKVFNHVSSYVLMHYTMSGRTDNAYWQHYADLEKQLNTRKECEEKAALPDTLVWQESSLFFPYSYWALLNGYNNK
jgi:tryptophan halogenase